MKKYIALKRFGGGAKLRSIYGNGVGRLVQLGTVISDEHFNSNTHKQDLIAKGLISEYDEKGSYETQADRDRRAKAQRRNTPAPDGSKPVKAKS